MNEERLSKLESDMMGLHEDVKANTALTLEVKNSVAELVETFNSLKGFWKVIEFIGKAAKPVAWISGMSAVLTIWWREIVDVIKHIGR